MGNSLIGDVFFLHEIGWRTGVWQLAYVPPPLSPPTPSRLLLFRFSFRRSVRASEKADRPRMVGDAVQLGGSDIGHSSRFGQNHHPLKLANGLLRVDGIDGRMLGSRLVRHARVYFLSRVYQLGGCRRRVQGGSRGRRVFDRVS